MAEADLRRRRRGEIVAAARQLVANGGIEALTFGALERQLDFTRGVITYHFRNKQDIVAAVLESAITEIDAATDARIHDAEHIEAQVRAVLETKVRGFLEHPEATRILLSFWAKAAHDPLASVVNRKLFRTYRKQTRPLLEHSRCDADAFAVLWVGTVIGIVTQAVIDPERVPIQRCIEEASELLAGRLIGSTTRVLHA